MKIRHIYIKSLLIISVVGCAILLNSCGDGYGKINSDLKLSYVDSYTGTQTLDVWAYTKSSSSFFDNTTNNVNATNIASATNPFILFNVNKPISINTKLTFSFEPTDGGYTPSAIKVNGDMASLCFVPYSKIDILNDAKSVNTKNPQDPVVDLIKKAFASVSPTGVILTPTIYSDGLPKSGSHIDDETLATVIKSYTTGETCSIRVKYSASYFMLDASALSSLASDDYFISCIKGFGSNVDMLFSAELDDYPMIGLNKYSVNYSSTKYKLNTI